MTRISTMSNECFGRGGATCLRLRNKMAEKWTGKKINVCQRYFI